MMKSFFLSCYNRFLRLCARFVIYRTHPYVIGVTGSVGKTTARMIITQTIQQQLPGLTVLTSPKNFNGEMGFALSVLGIESFTPSVGGYIIGAGRALWSAFFGKRVDVMVLEYGIDHKGEMDQMLAVTAPDVGLITRIDAVHSMQMGDPKQIAEEKRKMIDASHDVVFLNRDDEYVTQMIDRTVADILSYSFVDGGSGDVGYRNHKMVKDDNLYVASEVNIFAGTQEWSGRVSVLGKELVSYVAIAMSVSSLVSRRCDEKLTLVDNLEYQLQPGRASLFAGVGSSLIFDSSYNASPASMRAMLGVAYRIKHDVYCDNRPLIGVIGEMRELGDLSEQSHRKLAGILSQGLDEIILIGEEVKYIADELSKIGYPSEQINHFLSSRDAGERIKDKLQKDRPNSIVFVKGSQNTIYTEEVVKVLLVDPADIANIGRQEGRRMEKKENFFASVK